MNKKNFKFLTAIIAIGLSIGTISANGEEEGNQFKNTGKSRLIFGGNFLFDPNGLGGTIAKDGLTGNPRVASRDLDSNGSQEIYLQDQSLIYPDNKLKTISNVTGGAVHTKTGGPMTGGGLNLGWEKDVSDNFFFRISLNLNTKISGGHTTASLGGYNFYDVYWNFRSAIIPAYFGMKLNFGKNSAFYVAPGLHYYNAMWQLKGVVDGQFLSDALGTNASAVILELPRRSATGSGGAVINEDTVFRGHGVGFSYLIGAHTRISEKGFFFAEVETHVSGSLTSTGAVKSTGGAAALAPFPAYPVTVAGNYYRFGYKHEL
jgi:hypothetical protein